MGVGKTTISQNLKKKLDHCVFLDGDWCWDADPFQVTQETKEMVMDNICYMLNNFLHCSVYENIVFCWVMHEQSIIDDLLRRLDTSQCQVINISLLTNKESLRSRLLIDVEKGIRDQDVIERSIARIPLYDALDTIKIDTHNKSIDEITEEIMALKKGI